MAGISSGAWSRRRVSGEDRAFGGRQDLLCLVQEAGQYPKSSRQPVQSFEQGHIAISRTDALFEIFGSFLSYPLLFKQI